MILPDSCLRRTRCRDRLGAKAGMAKPVPPCAQSTKHFEDSWGDRSDINAPSRRGSYVVSALHARLAGFTCQLAHPPVAHVAEPTHEDFKSYLTPRAFVQAHRSPPPQNETTDTGQVDRYQREQAYDGTQMVCDARALAYRLVHRVTQKEPCRSRAEKEAPLTRQGAALPVKKRTSLISVPW